MGGENLEVHQKRMAQSIMVHEYFTNIFENEMSIFGPGGVSTIYY